MGEGENSAEKNANGRPDINDNPLNALARLGAILEMQGKMNPALKKVLESKLAQLKEKGLFPSVTVEKKMEYFKNTSASGSANTLPETPKINQSSPNYDRSTINQGVDGPRVVHGNAIRNFLFVLLAIAVAGYLAWQFGGPEFQKQVTDILQKIAEAAAD